MAYFLLTALAFLFGAYGVAAQVYFVRELLVVFFGNELCIGIVFTAWFAGIWTGAACGGRSAQRLTKSPALFVASFVALTLLPFFLLPVMRSLRMIMSIPAGTFPSLYHIIVGTGVSVCPFSFMVGFLFPVSCSMVGLHHRRASADIGWVYLWESAGSLAAGALLSFVLIPACSPLLFFAAGALLVHAACAALCAVLDPFGGKKFLFAGLCALIVISAGTILSGSIGRLDTRLELLRWQSLKTGQRFVDATNSKYQHLVLACLQEQYSLFANGFFQAAYPDRYTAAGTAHLLMCQHPRPRRVLLIGGGVTGLLREVLKHPVARVDYVELDPAIFTIMGPVLEHEDRLALNDPRVSTYFTDGRRYIMQARTAYDLIIVSAPEPSTALLNRLYTVEFFSEARRILAPGGALTTGMSSTAQYVSREQADYLASVYYGLKSVFPEVRMLPGETNYFLAASSPGVVSSDAAVLQQRFEGRNISTQYFSPALFPFIADSERVAFVRQLLSDRKPAVVNSDFHPVTYYYNLVLWDIVSGPAGGFSVMNFFSRRGFWYALVLSAAAVFFTAALVVVRRKRPHVRAVCLWAVAASGMAGMGMELVIVFLYQSLYGYVYEKIGIIVALFMAGLACGGWYVRRRIVSGKTASMPGVCAIQILLCALCAALPALFGSGWADRVVPGVFSVQEYMSAAVIYAVGLLGGMQFPLVCHVMIGFGCDPAKSAGWVDAMDHAGACAGSFFTGIFLLPLFGIGTSCTIIAVLLGTGAVLTAAHLWAAAERKSAG